MQIPVYIINLRRSTVRREHIRELMNDLGVVYEIIEGIDGDELSDDYIRNNSDIALWKDGSRTRFMRRGEIGCLLSHLKIYKKILEEGTGVACILEDDIVTGEGFTEFLRPESLNLPEWELLYLGHHTEHSGKEAWSSGKKRINFYNYKTGIPVELPGGSYGYLIKREAVSKILQHAFPLRMSVDHYIGNAPALGIKTILLSPPCVLHNYTFVTTMTHEKEPEYIDSLAESIRKQIRKIYIWIPFHQKLNKQIRAYLRRATALLRKMRLLKNSYAKYK